jgi:hypothetical protein
MTASNVPVLPDWTRWSWNSLVARDWYAPLFARAKNAFRELELLSVSTGLRDGAWVNVEVARLVEHTQRMQNLGLVVIPTRIAPHALHYCNTVEEGQQGPLTARCLHVRPETFAKPIAFQTSEQIGTLLGYPHCCRNLFARTWDAGQVDSTYDQYTNMYSGDRPGYSSTLWRHMGLRLVPHLPCSFSCQASDDLATRFTLLGNKHGYVEDLALIQEVQSWPVQWSRLFGIAELVSPAVRISTRTDWTPTKDSFFINGSYTAPTADLWQDNGFTSAEGMRKCHDLLLFSLKHAVAKDAQLCDLGCGNGMLLRRLRMHRPDVRMTGVDTNTRAVASIPFGAGRWNASRIEDFVWLGWSPTAVLISVARLEEMSQEDCERTLHALARIPQVFVYAYSDNLLRGRLQLLCAKAGIPVTPLVETPDVAMGIVSPK